MTYDDARIPDWMRDLTSPLDARLGLEIVEISPERAVGRMAVEGNTQPYGVWHGGASCVLTETLASLASAAHAHPDRVAMGVDINVTHHRAVVSGWVTGTATALFLGGSTTSYEVVLTDDEGRRIGTGRVTCALRPRR